MTVLDVNDESPMFMQRQYNVSLSEDVAFSSRPVLTLVAVDGDVGLAGQVVYHIESGDGLDQFQIDAHTGKLSVVAPLDYETKTSYR